MDVQYELCYNANMIIRAITRTSGSHSSRQFQCVCVYICLLWETGLKQSAQSSLHCCTCLAVCARGLQRAKNAQWVMPSFYNNASLLNLDNGVVINRSRNVMQNYEYLPNVYMKCQITLYIGKVQSLFLRVLGRIQHLICAR